MQVSCPACSQGKPNAGRGEPTSRFDGMKGTHHTSRHRGDWCSGDTAYIFEALFFKPEQYEILEGEVIEIVDFGAFVRIGPMDGLIHVSQVTDDYINFDAKRGALIAKESNKSLDEGDLVRARAVSVSIKDESTNNMENTRKSKIGLTMRQNNLGRFEWIEEAKQKSKG